MAVVFPVPMRSEGLPARGGPEIPKVDVPGEDEKEAEACAQARDWSTSPPSKERGADKLNFTSLFATWVDVFLQTEQRRPGSGYSLPPEASRGSFPDSTTGSPFRLHGMPGSLHNTAMLGGWVCRLGF